MQQLFGDLCCRDGLASRTRHCVIGAAQHRVCLSQLGGSQDTRHSLLSSCKENKNVNYTFCLFSITIEYSIVYTGMHIRGTSPYMLAKIS